MGNPPGIAKDGSLVTELIRPEREGSRNLSLARAVVSPNAHTWRHYHRRSEEVYYVVSGEGIIYVGAAQHRAQAGVAVLIPPGAQHWARCMSDDPLVILCCCSPAYDHDDTIITEQVLV